MRAVVMGYGLLSYLFFNVVFLYMGFFVADLWVPKTVSSGAVGHQGLALLIDIGLVSLFGLQHSIMAREGFKQWINRLMPEAIERSSYVLLSAVVLVVVMAFWQPLEGQVWQVENTLLRGLMLALMAVGLVVTLAATFLTSHIDLFGLRQVYFHYIGETYKDVEYTESFFYTVIRHPMMFGLLLFLWASPDMTLSKLVFSATMSVYIFIGVYFEEKDLSRRFGAQYDDYRSRVPMVLPRTKRK